MSVRETVNDLVDEAGRRYMRDLERADEIAYYGKASHPWWAFKKRLYIRWKAQELRDDAQRRHMQSLDHAMKVGASPGKGDAE